MSTKQLQIILENLPETVENLILILSDQPANFERDITKNPKCPIGCSVVMHLKNGKMAETFSPTIFTDNYFFVQYDRKKKVLVNPNTFTIKRLDGI